MTISDSFCCFFCLSPIGAALCFDKRNKPYVRCTVCGCRTFLPNPMGLNGLALIPPYVDGLIRQIQWDAEFARQKQQEIDSFLAALQARTAARSQPGGAEKAATPVLLPEKKGGAA